MNHRDTETQSPIHLGFSLCLCVSVVPALVGGPRRRRSETRRYSGPFRVGPIAFIICGDPSRWGEASKTWMDEPQRHGDTKDETPERLRHFLGVSVILYLTMHPDCADPVGRNMRKRYSPAAEKFPGAHRRLASVNRPPIFRFFRPSRLGLSGDGSSPVPGGRRVAKRSTRRFAPPRHEDTKTDPPEVCSVPPCLGGSSLDRRSQAAPVGDAALLRTLPSWSNCFHHLRGSLPAGRGKEDPGS